MGRPQQRVELRDRVIAWLFFTEKLTSREVTKIYGLPKQSQSHMSRIARAAREMIHDGDMRFVRGVDKSSIASVLGKV